MRHYFKCFCPFNLHNNLLIFFFFLINEEIETEVLKLVSSKAGIQIRKSVLNHCAVLSLKKGRRLKVVGQNRQDAVSAFMEQK